MAKYSFEFKKKIVNDYLSGKGGTEYLSKKYNVDPNGHGSTVKKWVDAYKAFGDDGLLRSRKNDSYTFEFKLYVVELYLSTEASYRELALSVGMNNSSLITKWVNDFRIAGPDALRARKKGRKKSLGLADKNKSNVTASENQSQDIDSKYLKQLEDENLKLRIENAYLKELRRLRLEDEAHLREQPESSTASEETSN